MAIRDSVQSIYQPLVNEGTQQIAEQAKMGTESLYSSLARRGMLNSNLLATGINNITDITQQNIGTLQNTYGSQMAETELQLQEIQRQEEDTKNWSLLNTAIKLGANAIMPVIGAPLASAAFNATVGGLSPEAKGIFSVLSNFTQGGNMNQFMNYVSQAVGSNSGSIYGASYTPTNDYGLNLGVVNKGQDIWTIGLNLENE